MNQSNHHNHRINQQDNDCKKPLKKCLLRQQYSASAAAESPTSSSLLTFPQRSSTTKTKRFSSLSSSMSTSRKSSMNVRKKLVIVGDGGVGKTCLLLNGLLSRSSSSSSSLTINGDDRHNKYFFEHYCPTVLVTTVHTLNHQGRKMEVALWDTAGNEEYSRLRPFSYAKCDVILLCFAIDSMCSFLNVKRKWEPELHHYCPKVPIILVGTKKDLLHQQQQQQQRSNIETSYDQRAFMANSIEAVDYWECSAKTGDGIDRLIEIIIDTAFGSKKDDYRLSINGNQQQQNVHSNQNNNYNESKSNVKEKPIEPKQLPCHII